MRATITPFVLALFGFAVMACSGQKPASSTPPRTVTPGEAARAARTEDPIRVSGCLTRLAPDRYILTSLDDVLDERATSGRHQDNPDTRPTDANRGAESERARHEQNVSAEFGRYRLAGDAARFARHVDHEVEITGRVIHVDRENSTPLLASVDTIKSTGAICRAR